MSAWGHSRPGSAGRRSSHVRYAPKATVGHQNAIGRDGPKCELAAHLFIVPAAGLIELSARRQAFICGHAVRNEMERLALRREDRHLRAAIY
jgi:hypothetical protein